MWGAEGLFMSPRVLFSAMSWLIPAAISIAIIAVAVYKMMST
jgi:hypothetical protein